MRSATNPSTTTDTPQFWRDPTLPFIEARSIHDGRHVCYARHAHETFSVGAVTCGQSTYLNGRTEQRIAAGTLVLMNPGAVHACNPIQEQRWSYLMFYVDTQWLGTLQQELGLNADGGFLPIASVSSVDTDLYDGLNDLYALLIDTQTDGLLKHSTIICYFSLLLTRLGGAVQTDKNVNLRLESAAAFIREHCTEALSLEAICNAANLSASYLIRAFEQRYGLTPHAFLINQRIQFAQTQLKEGKLIADVALEAGFADQAHFQRAFKKYLAATPGQYRA